MAPKDCCRTCQHCGPGSKPVESWCRLRKLTMHVELTQYAFCHHWTRRSPSLPSLQEKSSLNDMDKQLELGRSLPSFARQDDYSVIQ